LLFLLSLEKYLELHSGDTILNYRIEFLISVFVLLILWFLKKNIPKIFLKLTWLDPLIGEIMPLQGLNLPSNSSFSGQSEQPHNQGWHKK